MTPEDFPAMPVATRPLLLGVINLSPESMVVDSIAQTDSEILERAAWLKAQGCSIIDLGARSITHDAPEVCDSVEQQRLAGPLRLLVENGYRVSVDTWSSDTVLAALSGGASVINFTGATISPVALAAIAKAKATLILTYMPYGDAYHMRQAEPIPYRIKHILDHLAPRVDEARKAGVGEVIIDPNLGIIHPSVGDYGKVELQNGVLWHLYRLRALGCPILLYAARKPEFLGRILFASNVLHANPEYIRTHHPDILNQLMAADTNESTD
ncbi:MAG: hypothetical protein EBT06_08575 [Gammaproteobacteria bacterium]|nr:hypothetical protein [Gammaproteobacteria bacterium]NBT44963.1 hypothetical protein [Gammaproteobacteria bacterium]NBY23950.1 hypothetical protein [Gammaproteobacteria bacterium]NDE34278.1 hypothetical protein [Gammaproteobacteria bacterium]NDE56229.1 hypothetical protein [Gammaproteobacteria bacterium]